MVVCGKQKQFRCFINETELNEIVLKFNALYEIAELNNKSNKFSFLKNTFHHANKQLFDTLEAKRNEEQYSENSFTGKQTLIVGAGPAGFITAIECVLHGGSAVVIEKRQSFTRNNVILLWDYTVDFLKSLGVKSIFPRFCSGGLHHIGIRRLQCVLLKIALLLGVQFIPGVNFDRMEFRDSKWVAVISTNTTEEKNSESLLSTNGNVLKFDALFGADGLNSKVAEFVQFERKTMKAKQAIGMTFNFVNSRTRDEVLLNEFAYSRHLKQMWFQRLQEKTSIELENCVYYRDETHYFVCTIPKESLLRTGIARNNFSDSDCLLDRENLDEEKMKQFACQLANHCGLPDGIEMKLNNHGLEDIQLFDFTKKLAATEQIRFLPSLDYLNDTNPLLVALVGDALLEPFWPQGTGANRALLSSLDAIFCCKNFFSLPDSTESIVKHSNKILHQLHISTQQKIQFALKKSQLDKIGTKTFAGCSCDPSSRYVGFKL